MKYKITVIKYDTNPAYEAEMAKYKEDNRGGYFSQRQGLDENAPTREIAERSLEVFLNEEEYEAIKKAVLETFK